MTLPERAVASCLLPFLVVCCAEGAGNAGDTTTVDTLPNGAILVQNAGDGVWDSASAWRFVEETRIGSIEGEGPDVFAEIRAMEVDDHGRVWVLDAQQKKIEVFDSDGRHVRTIGGPGAGPGEFEYPIGIERDALGRMWVLDARNARFTLFDSTGAYVTSHRREVARIPWRWEGGITDDGRVFESAVDFGSTSAGSDFLIVRDSTGIVTDTVDLPRFEQEVFELRVDGVLMQTTPVPFSPRLVWALAGDGTLWFGTTDAYRLVNRTMAGDTVRILEKEWTPVPVTQDEREEALAFEWFAEMRQRGATIDPGRVPANKPAWGWFWLDDDGHIWVRATSADGRPSYDVFDPEGRYLGVASLGDATLIAPPVFRDDRAWIPIRGELDVPYVAIGRLAGRDAGD